MGLEADIRGLSRTLDQASKASGRLLTTLRKDYSNSAYVFTHQARHAVHARTINRLVKIIGQLAGLPLPVHFHMLRHCCGYKLANMEALLHF